PAYNPRHFLCFPTRRSSDLPEVARYASEKPVLDLRTYFQGTLDAYGVFTDRSGAVVKRFNVVMRCQWTGDDGVLDEDFSYSDGTDRKSTRLNSSHVKISYAV